MQTAINLRQKRGLGETISTTFSYLRYHFKPLYKMILAVSGPVFLIGALFIGGFYGNLFSRIGSYGGASDYSFMNSFFIGFLVFALALVVLNGLITEYMKASLSTPKKEITFGQVLQGFKVRSWRYLGATLLMMFLTAIGFLLFTIPGIWLWVVFSLMFFTIGIENNSIGEAFSRCFALMKRNWWSSFGLFLLTGILQTALTYAIMIPVFLINSLAVFSSTDPGLAGQNAGLGISITTTITFFVTALAYSISIVAAGVNYFRIVEEKEEVGLKQRIEAVDTQD